MHIFIAGPYGDTNPPEVIEQNIENADEVAKLLVLAGHIPFCPHKMTAHWERDDRLEEKHWIGVDMDYLCTWADAILRIPGESRGADDEIRKALSLGLRVFFSTDEIPDENRNDIE